MIGKLLEDGNKKLAEKGIGGKNGAETANGLRLNREYIDSLAIETRLIDAVEAATEMKLFGGTFSTPVMVAALGGLNGVYPNSMVEIAKGAAAANTVMWVGTGDEAELKAIIGTGAKTIKVVQPYKDTDLIYEKIHQAEKNGAFAVGMDIDYFFGGEIGDSRVMSNILGPRTLNEIKKFVQATKLPFILKGVLSVQDAQKALDIGAGAIVVSNHGGSVLDYAVPPLKALPKIAKIIDKKIPIIVDSGITRGTDVFKALALGATGVLVGRTVVAGLACEGMEGVRKILEGTNEELRRTLSLTGCQNINDIEPSLIWS
ncbi:alpha-hydroxy acid oxidase [Caproiciproducens faecalis]|uniref:L-lactate oxidase n=1 Tax=Caproiciproducens faecalis TaxID=2820301 RepID=A0ABS7DMV0_9FIRM|nr:alpha-hydroxy acid oxidase [Caproiciproducens faecalis]MBW7571876.1 alpha-hydroxy-acid oxidizing protein [Caproiciproducens faecalis]